MAAAGHLLLILGYGQSDTTARAGGMQHTNGRSYKNQENQMATQYPPAYPSASNTASPV